MSKTILITGGAGFIGVNASEQFILDGWNVIVLDNLSRYGTSRNIRYLTDKYVNKFEFIKCDIRGDLDSLQKAVNQSQVILHLAGQVAVTTSIENPREDFEVNALGTFNVLEAIRKASHKPFLVYSSTNKVYGGMEDIDTIEGDKRYSYKDLRYGISEDRYLDFHSPYGCSKGAADQYVIDYARIYSLPTVVFRQSCIYGPHQFGIEDQGWVAWFTIAAVNGKPITIFGNGKQVRDLLYIDDLINLYKLAIYDPEKVNGKVYNLGGGLENSMSLLELINYLEEALKVRIAYAFSDWRQGDQPVYISDIRRITSDLGWHPEVSPCEGINNLASWVEANKELFV